MNENLIKFIDICLVDGIITEKERKVIFRKSKELGVPEDECEIILEGMIMKYHNSVKHQKESIIKENSFKDEILDLEDLEIEETPDKHLKKIFESKHLDILNIHKIKRNQIQDDLDFMNKELNSFDEELKKNWTKIWDKQKFINKLWDNTKFNIEKFEDELRKYLEINLTQKENSYIKNLDESKLNIYEIKKGFFGKKDKGELKTFNWIEFFKSSVSYSDYFLSENDLKLLNDIKYIYNKQLEQVKKPDIDFNKKIKTNERVLKKLFEKKKQFTLKEEETKERIKKSKNHLKELDDEIEYHERVINSNNFLLFKKLYNDSPILFQSKIFSKYLQVIDIKNDKQIENLSRFLKFIIKKEKEYSNKISYSFEKLEIGKLTLDDTDKLFSTKNNLKLFYNSFHIMYQSLVSNKMGLYMKVYIELERLGIFSTFFEKSILNNLNQINRQLKQLDSTLEIVCSEMSQNNNYLNLLNTRMYDLKLSVDETNINLTDMSTSINEGNNLLKEGNDLLEGINSSMGLNNLLTGIQTYQLYKINSNTKSLRS